VFSSLQEARARGTLSPLALSTSIQPSRSPRLCILLAIGSVTEIPRSLYFFNYWELCGDSHYSLPFSISLRSLWDWPSFAFPPYPSVEHALLRRFGGGIEVYLLSYFFPFHFLGILPRTVSRLPFPFVFTDPWTAHKRPDELLSGSPSISSHLSCPPPFPVVQLLTMAPSPSPKFSIIHFRYSPVRHFFAWTFWAPLFSLELFGLTLIFVLENIVPFRPFFLPLCFHPLQALLGRRAAFFNRHRLFVLTPCSLSPLWRETIPGSHVPVAFFRSFRLCCFPISP